MIRRENLHEKESFELRLRQPIHGQEVIAHFTRLGASAEDDFFFEDRSEPVPPWQALSFYTASCLLSDAAAYPDESQVDCITFEYLFASTPTGCFSKFAKVLWQTSERFNVSVLHSGIAIMPADLLQLFESWMTDLQQEVAEEPGSEFLAILIQDLFYS